MLSSAAKNKGIGENIFAGMENPLVRAGNLWHNECAYFCSGIGMVPAGMAAEESAVKPIIHCAAGGFWFLEKSSKA